MMRTPIAGLKLSVAIALFAVVMSALSPRADAQTVPTRIPLRGELRGADGLPRTGTVLLVISLYEAQTDPAPRWVEQQVVTLDAAGRYSVQIGATLPDGLPQDLFTGQTATRWI